MPPARRAAGAGGAGVTTHTTNSFVRRGSTSAPGAPRLQTLTPVYEAAAVASDYANCVEAFVRRINYETIITTHVPRPSYKSIPLSEFRDNVLNLTRLLHMLVKQVVRTRAVEVRAPRALYDVVFVLECGGYGAREFRCSVLDPAIDVVSAEYGGSIEHDAVHPPAQLAELAEHARAAYVRAGRGERAGPLARARTRPDEAVVIPQVSSPVSGQRRRDRVTVLCHRRFIELAT
ncbi:unnamed protein product [Spodoptera exigua]|nr:unnamed protein product [Spodoptera exigua]